MTRRMEHTLAFAAPAAQIHALFVSEDYWRSLAGFYRRLDPGTELTEFRAAGGGADVALRQVLPRADLPQIARKVIPVDMVITRRQHFAAYDAEKHWATGTFEATMPRAPGRLRGDYELSDTGTGCSFRVRSSCKVSIPLIGGTLEDLVLTNMRIMFNAERDFTAGRLSARG
ncbi:MULTISPECIES: DUF2505 domain-containing protein [Mycobacteriaceae]|uniref:DUF2505 domain-containing protein n=1 Tax=Mycobacteriaceae TaxID=1762 RepID=UPI001E50B4BF|nr:MULTISPECIES: DUF2505 domain-containing protein [Mycobacteriaceae]MCK0175723.1 DUF2505 domain-containing protein [Mycolicibacterium sp. F2034L]